MHDLDNIPATIFHLAATMHMSKHNLQDSSNVGVTCGRRANSVDLLPARRATTVLHCYPCRQLRLLDRRPLHQCTIMVYYVRRKHRVTTHTLITHAVKQMFRPAIARASSSLHFHVFIHHPPPYEPLHHHRYSSCCSLPPLTHPCTRHVQCR